MPPEFEPAALAVLEARHVPGPPAPPFEAGVGYPLAFDVSGSIAAVSFAVLDDRGWWCRVVPFAYDGEAWRVTGGEYGGPTSPLPFQRPSDADWVAWTGHDAWDGERHSSFGIAAARTARLTVTTPDGGERDVAITPWNGAYVVVAAHSTLTGYSADGTVFGSVDRPAPAPELANEPIVTWKFRDDRA
jgi:hypothetical protein